MEEIQPVDEFDAGFDGINEVQTPTPEPVEATPEPEAPKYAQITEEQYKELLSKATAIDEIKAEQKKQFDAAFGKIGGMQQLLDQLKNPGEIDISEEDFDELNAEFPELAALHVKGLKKALAKVRGNGAAFDPSIVEKVVQERLEMVKQDLQREALKEEHKDWEEVVKDEKFIKWKETLPEQERQELDESWSAKFIAKKISEYKSSLNPPASPPKKSSRQEVLEAAVTPRGVGGHAPAPSEDDEFNAGFNSR